MTKPLKVTWEDWTSYNSKMLSTETDFSKDPTHTTYISDNSIDLLCSHLIYLINLYTYFHKINKFNPFAS